MDHEVARDVPIIICVREKNLREKEKNTKRDEKRCIHRHTHEHPHINVDIYFSV